MNKQRYHVASQMVGLGGGQRTFTAAALNLAATEEEKWEVRWNPRFVREHRTPQTETPEWWKATKVGLLPGIVRAAPPVEVSTTSQSGGDQSPLRSERISKKEQNDLLYGHEQKRPYGWRGRARRTDERDTAIRMLRRKMRQNGGGDRWV